jgi:hypothetical protein
MQNNIHIIKKQIQDTEARINQINKLGISSSNQPIVNMLKDKLRKLRLDVQILTYNKQINPFVGVAIKYHTKTYGQVWYRLG